MYRPLLGSSVGMTEPLLSCVLTDKAEPRSTSPGGVRGRLNVVVRGMRILEVRVSQLETYGKHRSDREHRPERPARRNYSYEADIKDTHYDGAAVAIV